MTCIHCKYCNRYVYNKNVIQIFTAHGDNEKIYYICNSQNYYLILNSSDYYSHDQIINDYNSRKLMLKNISKS